jgi:uncharacterized membrane protein YbhN (UPF0104 family)
MTTTSSKDSTKQQKTSVKRRVFQLISWLISFGLLYWIFFVKLPQDVDISQVWTTVQALTLSQNFFLCMAGLLTVWAVGWTAATVLPGLPVSKATEASVVGQMTSVALPPPLDMVIRFTMYKTYGFSADKSAIAVVIAGIARYFTVVAIPLIGMAAIIIAGQGSSRTVVWFIGVGIVFLFALWLMRLILSSKKSAKAVGVVVQKIVNIARKLIRRKPLTNLSDDVVDFGARTSDVAVTHFKPIAVSNIAWGLSCFVVFLLSVRFCGIDASIMSTPVVLLIAGCMLLLNCIPLTPGGIGISEAVLLSVIPFSGPEVEAAFTAALFVYRVYTWLLPMPLGIVAYITWRLRIKKLA